MPFVSTRALTWKKNHQIPFMREIFRKAEQVLVWLGEEADDSDEAMRVLSMLTEKHDIKDAIGE